MSVRIFLKEAVDDASKRRLVMVKFSFHIPLLLCQIFTILRIFTEQTRKQEKREILYTRVQNLAYLIIFLYSSVQKYVSYKDYICTLVYKKEVYCE